MFRPLKIAKIGGLISLPKLLCEKNVLVYGYCWNRWVKFFKKLFSEFFCYGPWKLEGYLVGRIFSLLSCLKITHHDQHDILHALTSH
jgi:hypothetical protein